MAVAMAVQKPALGPDADKFVAKQHKMLINGKWGAAKSGKTLAVEDPATLEEIAKVPAGDKADIDLAVAAARAAFETGPWSRLSPIERAKIVWRLGDLLEKHADEFAQLEALDNGKPVTNARRDDVQGSVEMFRYMSGWATRMNGETIQVSSPGNWHAYTLREPVGVVGQIIPWNFPLMMAAWKLAPALASGCTIVLKPAEQTPLSALRIGELIQEVGIPDGVVNIVTGFGETAGAALAEHPDVDKVAFTGSTEVGKLIVKAAAGNLKRVSLELGGKSPAIVFPDADLERAIAGTASAIFYNQGQCCTAGSRLFAHKSVYDKVVAGIAAEAGKLKIGHGLDPSVNLGPLVSKEQHDRVTGFIEAGRKEGAKVVVGGKVAGNRGYFVEPTVLANTNRNMKVVREEIFGPVVCVQSFDDDSLDAVAKFANDTEYGLQASVWTQNLRVAHMMARKIKAGTICINNHNYGDPAWPFGGYKQSGWGREMGKEVMEHYTETKAVAARL
ncbi:MAG: aldehyde dehydrogenase family protein [Alphaproteobacteria bacterium]|nr:aldehyde dehydrogenase family protein [Alphaproteobacteria bacterium]